VAVAALDVVTHADGLGARGDLDVLVERHDAVVIGGDVDAPPPALALGREMLADGVVVDALEERRSDGALRIGVGHRERGGR